MVGGALLRPVFAWLNTLAGPLDFTVTGALKNLPGLDPLPISNHLWFN